MNTLLFQLITLQTLNCQALNNLCSWSNRSIFVLQSKLTDFSAILKQQKNDTASRLISPPKKRPGTRAIINSAQLQNNCPLFVWQNQGSFMQSVIKARSLLNYIANSKSIFLHLQLLTSGFPFLAKEMIKFIW